MKKNFGGVFYLVALLCINAQSFAQTQPWIKLQSPVSSTLLNLSFVDSLTGWAAGEAGTIIRTTNGGFSWEIQNSTVQSFITDIYFVNKNIGWALTLKEGFPFTSVILKTTNGGTDWSALDFPDTTKILRTIFFLDSLNGFIGGSYIGYTNDGGNTWEAASVDSNIYSNFPVYQFNFLNHQFGYACGGRIDIFGVVWRTTNSGLNWTSMSPGADEVFDIFIFDSLNAISLSGDPEGFYGIFNIKTTDAGLSWNSNELPFTGLSFAIDFRNDFEGWSASGYKFLRTTNRGETWEEFETPDAAGIFDLQFTDARTGYAVGEGGIILKLDPSLVDVKSEPGVQDKFVLNQNYPNPFNPSTKIGFHISDHFENRAGFKLVTIKVYDVLGNEVAALINEEKPVGAYEVEFNASGLPSGIYFYQMKSGEFVQTKKMIYLK